MKKLLLLLAVVCGTASYSQAILPVLAPPNSGTSTQLRAPNGTAVATRGVTIVRASELTPLLGASNTIQSLGFSLDTAAAVSGANTTAITGTVNIYLLNTTDVTYTKGTDWTVATANMVQVCTNCAFTIPPNKAPSYDVTLSSPFAYLGSGMNVAYDFTITNGLIVAPDTALITYKATNGLAASLVAFQGAAPASNTLSSTAFRPEFRFGITNPNAVDNIVARIFAPGKIPVGGVSDFSKVRAAILNRGANNATNLSVTMTVSGANTFTNTKVIPNIIAGQDAIVEFDAFNSTLVGTNNIVVSVAPDNNPNPNNSLSLAVETTCGTISHANNVSPVAASGIGFNTGAGLLLTKLKLAAGRSAVVSGVNVTFADAAPPTATTTTVGRIVRGVVVDLLGNMLAVSADYTILAGDIGVAKNFTFSTPATIPAGAEYFVGLWQTADVGSGYFPVASQTIASPTAFLPSQSNIAPVNGSQNFSSSPPPATVTSPTTTLPVVAAIDSKLMIDAIIRVFQFTNTTAPAASTGVAYSFSAAATATSGTLAYSVSPALPAGLSINATTGLISGTPTTATASASYTVTASTAGVCSATQAYTIQVTLGNNDFGFSNKFSVSPNPTKNIVNISSSDNTAVNGVSIVDLNGRVIKEISYNNISNIQVNLTDLADGMYIMNIKSEQGIATKKILKN